MTELGHRQERRRKSIMERGRRGPESERQRHRARDADRFGTPSLSSGTQDSLNSYLGCRIQ